MEKEKTILDYDTVALDEAQDAVIIIDQTLLPGRIELIALHTAQEIWDAIYLLKVRGAPAIGVAAALGIYLLANRIETEDFEKFYEKFTEYKEYLVLQTHRSQPVLGIEAYECRGCEGRQRRTQNRGRSEGNPA